MINPTLLAATAAAIVGLAAIWSNNKRAINRLFFSGSLHVALWLVLLHITVTADTGLPWLRLTSAVGALTASHLWLIKEAIVNENEHLYRRIWRGRWWNCFVLMLVLIPFTNFFIPSHSEPDAPIYGHGYYVFIVGVILAFCLLSRDTLRQMRVQAGVKRIELQIVLLGGSAAAFAIIFLMGLRGVLGMPWLVRIQPFVILLFYAGTAIAITTHRIFDAKQILLAVLRKTVLVVVVAISAYLTDGLFALFLPESLVFVIMVAVTLWLGMALNNRFDRMFNIYPKATAAREAVYAIARRESRIDVLDLAFVGILKGWGNTEHALLLSGIGGVLRGGGVEIPDDNEGVKALRQLRWVTPERLARERSTPARAALARFLEEHNLGALVIGEGLTLTIFIGVGVPVSRRPFTYPQVEQLMELAAIIQSALERAHYSVKAQRAEQLATVGLLGASLAHEIRNPLVTIKTFVQLLPQHHQDPAFRDKFFKLIGDEVTRIDHLTEQLLDLASPRAYTAQLVELHPILRANLELVAAKAADKGIEFLTDFQASPDFALTDPSAAKQVLLNLCFNALQAVEGREGERWVKVSTRNVSDGLEMTVEDSGPGIAPEIRPRLFQPFQTTKSSGFGLGLAICSDILAALNTTITVAPTVAGRGATFRIVFPCKA